MNQITLNLTHPYTKTIWAEELLKTNDFTQTITKEPFIIENIKFHKTSEGVPFIRLELSDKTGKIGARIWNEDFPSCQPESLAKGDIVLVWGELNQYQDRRYIRITRIQKIKDDEIDIAQLTPNVLRKDINKLWERLIKIIETIQNPYLKQLLHNLFSDPKIANAFRKAAAAEIVHHDYMGGLLEHTLEMIDIAEAILKHYPEADRDLVITGIILHDIGKIIEYETHRTTVKRTKLGYLLGHIYLGVELISQYLPKDFPEEYKLQLFHTILAHHGELEYGSPVRPATIEAIIVSAVDDVSTKVKQFQKELNTKTPDEQGFGEYHKYIRTRVYFSHLARKKHKESNKDKKQSADSLSSPPLPNS